jgi:CheY-like chemotaxis protein
MQERTSVLCALGDERQRGFICDQLAADGYPVEAAACPSELQIRARRRPPGVLLLGRLEHRHDELALLRAIRAGDAVRADIDPAVAVIVLGAEPGELWLLRAFAAGCDDWLACRLPGAARPHRRARPAGRSAGIRSEAPRRAADRPPPPTRQLRRSAARAVGARVRATQPAGQRPDPLLYQARAAARRLGLPGARQNQDRGRPRLPAT